MLNTITNFHHSSNYILKGTTRFLPNAISSKSILASTTTTKARNNHQTIHYKANSRPTHFLFCPSFRRKASCRETTMQVGPYFFLQYIYRSIFFFFFYVRIVHFWLDESRMKGTHSIPLAHLRWPPTLRWNDT